MKLAGCGLPQSRNLAQARGQGDLAQRGAEGSGWKEGDWLAWFEKRGALETRREADDRLGLRVCPLAWGHATMT